MKKTNSLKLLQEWMDSYLNFEKTPKKNIFWLDTMNFLCEKFGHPQDFAPCFHVAGSKGKGSVSMFIASILDAAGYKTGLYTSPHILDFVERVSTPRGSFDDDVYDKAVNEIMEGIKSIPTEELPGQRPLTWFELVTLFAFLTFRVAKVDYSVFEVGLGGRLDSTNVITPKISVITPIELEHTEFLGDTVEKIAFEKGGIIKENVPVVIAGQKSSVREVFKKIAVGKNSPIYFADEMSSDLSFSYKDDGKMDVSFKSDVFSRKIKAMLSLPGKFQAENALLASLAVKLALPQTTEDAIEQGLSNAYLPARFEIVKNPDGFKDIPFLILDGAHTLNSVKFTVETFKTIFEGIFSTAKTKKILIFGCAADKDVKDMAIELKGVFDEYYLTKPGEIKISDLPAMEKAFSDAGISFEWNENYKEVINQVLEKGSREKSFVMATGSFYLVSEVKKILAKSSLPKD